MEELLKQLVIGQKQLFEGQKELFKRIEQLSEGQNRLFEGQKQLFEGQKQLFEGQKQLFEGQKDITNRLDHLEGQVRENTDFIKAILHRTEELDAKFDGLLHTTLTKESLSNLATKADVASLDAKLEVLNVRLFRQEAELCRLHVAT